jgi:hypothetical protein
VDKLLYKKNINVNEPLFKENEISSIYKTQFGLPLQSFRPSLKLLNKSKSITGVGNIKKFIFFIDAYIKQHFSKENLDELRQSLPVQLKTIKDSYKTMRKSESDLLST